MFNVTCDPKSETDCQSESLETVVEEVRKRKTTDLEIIIKIRQLQLDATLNFTNLSSLDISGEPAGLTNIACPRDGISRAGIVLSDINGRVLLQNLNLSFCGLKIDSKFGRDNSKLYSALTISRCKNVELDKIVIARSQGLGLQMTNTQGSHVTFTSTIFEENENLMPKGAEDQVYGGGGAYILLEHSPDDQSLPTTFLFRNCSFENNTARTKHYEFIYNDALGMLRSGYG